MRFEIPHTLARRSRRATPGGSDVAGEIANDAIPPPVDVAIAPEHR